MTARSIRFTAMVYRRYRLDMTLGAVLVIQIVSRVSVTEQKYIISLYLMFTSKPTLFPVYNAVSALFLTQSSGLRVPFIPTLPKYPVIVQQRGYRRTVHNVCMVFMTKLRHAYID